MKMLLKKDTIDFPFIHVGHKNENVVRKKAKYFLLIYVRHKYENVSKKDTIQFPLIYVGHKNENIVKKRDNTIFVDLCWT